MNKRSTTCGLNNDYKIVLKIYKDDFQFKTNQTKDTEHRKN